MPIDHVVVGELGVVGDVSEVLEDLLARKRDGGLDRDRIHAWLGILREASSLAV
jgi:hypothetical protein